MGQAIVIENRVGASARIGTASVAKAPPDGYTLLFNNSSHAANVAQYKKLPYDALADFAPITQVNGTSGNLLVIHPSFPARSVKELIALARKLRNELNYATAGVGSPQHVAGALFASMAGIQLVHVPYKGTLAALTDVMGGRAEIPLDWQRGEVTTTEGTDAEGRPVKPGRSPDERAPAASWSDRHLATP